MPLTLGKEPNLVVKISTDKIVSYLPFFCPHSRLPIGPPSPWQELEGRDRARLMWDGAGRARLGLGDQSSLSGGPERPPMSSVGAGRKGP